ncbi:MAG: Gfo/Idh/MocA family oxidoreductase, partial [Oscillospiraceae bacterium]
MKKVKVGIIGCGGIANGKHLPALKHLVEQDIIELVAFCDIIEERAVKAAKEFGAE